MASKLTKAQRSALEVVRDKVRPRGGAAESNTTDSDKGTIYWQAARALVAAKLIRQMGTDEHMRPMFRITPQGLEALGDKPAKRAPATVTAIATKAKHRPEMTFFHDGKPVAKSWGKVCNLAYFYTAGIDGDAPRVSTKRLKEILAEAGITDPEATSWKITLANGITLEAKASRTPKAKAS